MIRNDIKQNFNKIKKAQDTINTLEKKKEDIIDENLKNERELPNKEKDLKDIAKAKQKKEAEFEATEMKVRETTEKLRRNKDRLESEYNPLQNQFNQIKSNIDIKR